MKKVRHLTRLAALGAASLALVFAMPSVSNASAPVNSAADSAPTSQNHAERSARQLTHDVLLSSDPHAAFDALTAHEQAVFLHAFRNQTSVTVADSGGRYTPTAAERARMQTTTAPATIRGLATDTAAATSGCWYHYYQKSWSDLGIHDGDSWMQLNWCSYRSSITSWNQSNVGCAGHHGASCSVQSKAERNVGWEIRSSRYYQANFFGFSNTFCMQIRGGATGLYSTRSSNSGVCSLS